jgi:hypothetical protein
MVLVLDAVFSSTSTSIANAEYEYEKPGKTSIETPKHANSASSKLMVNAPARQGRCVFGVTFGEWGVKSADAFFDFRDDLIDWDSPLFH